MLNIVKGLLGVAVGLGGIGTTYYFLNSKVSSDNNPSPVATQTEDIKLIEVSLKCSRELSGKAISGGDFTFNWSGKLDKEQLDKLKRDRVVDLEGEFRFKDNSKGGDVIGKFTKDVGEVYLTAQLGNAGKLNIILAKNTSKSNLLDSATFWCDTERNEWKKLKEGGESGLISLVKMIARDFKTLSGSDSKKSNMKVSLVDCHDDSAGKTTTCLFQLSDSSEKNWIIKLSDKEKLTFSK